MSQTVETGAQLRLLAGEALEHARELFRAELYLAKLELTVEAKRAGIAALFLALSLVLLHAGFLVIVAAIILALFAQPLAAAAVGLVLIVLSAGAALAALAAFKRRHLARTRAGLSRDVALLRWRRKPNLGLKSEAL
jgi:hypothetical protein